MESAEETAKIVSNLPEAEEIIETEGPWSDRKDDDEEVSNVDDVDDELPDTPGVSAYGISAASGTNAAASKRGLPKLREIMRRQKQDSEVVFRKISPNPFQSNYDKIQISIFDSDTIFF